MYVYSPFCFERDFVEKNTTDAGEVSLSHTFQGIPGQQELPCGRGKGEQVLPGICNRKQAVMFRS